MLFFMLSEDIRFCCCNQWIDNQNHLREEKKYRNEDKKPQFDKDSYFGENVHWVHAQNNDDIEWTYSLMFLSFRKFICTSFQYKHRL